MILQSLGGELDASAFPSDCSGRTTLNGERGPVVAPQLAEYPSSSLYVAMRSAIAESLGIELEGSGLLVYARNVVIGGNSVWITVSNRSDTWSPTKCFTLDRTIPEIAAIFREEHEASLAHARKLLEAERDERAEKDGAP